MQYSGFISELYRLLGITLLCAIVGLLVGHLKLALSTGVLLYLLYHLHQLNQLLHWLQKPKLKTIPDANGVWGQIFDLLSRSKRREIRQKNRLKSVIFQIDATTTALNDAVILLDRSNELTWWNPATVRLLDFKKTDTGSNIINLIRHPDFVRYLEAEDYAIPLTLPSPRALEKQLEFQITRFGEGEGLLVVRDVTRLFKLEQMRKDFVANVSHELRTPLTVIRGYLETLEDTQPIELKKNQIWPKALMQMQQQAKRMTTLINDLTMLSKLETDSTNNHQDVVELKPLLEMICSEARTITGDRQQNIHLHCEENLKVIGNESELHSAFSNLVTNAIKYSDAQTTIEIQAELQNNGNLNLSVQDQGIGIEHQHLGRLTERFYRVDDDRSIASGGTGLGLAIVKHILLRHDAHLTIDSTPGKGSAFCCIFPAQRIDPTFSASPTYNV